MCRKHDHYAQDCKHNKSQNDVNDVQADDNIIVIVSKTMTIKCKV